MSVKSVFSSLLDSVVVSFIRRWKEKFFARVKRPCIKPVYR
jgi:hypothetical protein